MKDKIKRNNGIAILIAVTVVLAFVSNYVTLGSVNINLALIPIVVAACIYGPVAGLILGLVDGLIICIAPSTLTYFMPHNPLLTIILCLVKTGVGGYVSGLVYSLFKTRNQSLGVLLASIALPIVNTSIFLLGVFGFFVPVYISIQGSSEHIFKFIILSTLTINFLIEFIVNILLSSSIYRIIKIKR